MYVNSQYTGDPGSSLGQHSVLAVHIIPDQGPALGNTEFVQVLGVTAKELEKHVFFWLPTPHVELFTFDTLSWGGGNYSVIPSPLEERSFYRILEHFIFQFDNRYQG